MEIFRLIRTGNLSRSLWDFLSNLISHLYSTHNFDSRALHLTYRITYDLLAFHFRPTHYRPGRRQTWNFYYRSNSSRSSLIGFVPLFSLQLLLNLYHQVGVFHSWTLIRKNRDFVMEVMGMMVQGAYGVCVCVWEVVDGAKDTPACDAEVHKEINILRFVLIYSWRSFSTAIQHKKFALTIETQYRAEQSRSLESSHENFRLEQQKQNVL